MSLIATAAEAAVKAEADRVIAEQRARLQAAFTEGGKVLVDVTKLTVAKADAGDGLLVLTDGTYYVASSNRLGLRLVDRLDGDRFSDGRQFTTLTDLGLLLAAG